MAPGKCCIRDMEEERLEWLYEFIVNGCEGIIRKWALNGFESEPEEIAEFMAQMFRSCVQGMETGERGPAKGSDPFASIFVPPLHILILSKYTLELFMRQRLFKVSFSAFLVIMIIGCSVKYMAGHAKVARNVSGRELPIYSVDTPEKKAALTFDAAWGNESTQKLLDILAKYKVHATFFMTGGWVEKYPEDVKAIPAAGHDLGNHSETPSNI